MREEKLHELSNRLTLNAVFDGVLAVFGFVLNSHFVKLLFLGYGQKACVFCKLPEKQKLPQIGGWPEKQKLHVFLDGGTFQKVVTFGKTFCETFSSVRTRKFLSTFYR